jgi:L-threonylcarbamoyladenylate synthase
MPEKKITKAIVCPMCGEMSEDIKSAVDYIVGYRQEETGRPKPSSIIKLGKGGVIKIIRE